MRIAHFIQRYPPALGGAEAYFARLSRFLVDQGDDVTIFTSSAIDLEAFWSPRGRCVPPGVTQDGSVQVRRYGLATWPGRRYLLKALSLLPHRLWQCLTLPCNPLCPGMWRDAGRRSPCFDAVHAAAFPYAWPIACGLRLARRQRIPLFITPFLHLGDPDDDADRTRRGYLAPPLAWLLRQADGIVVQTPSERAAVLDLGVASENVIVQGLGVEPAECTGGDRAGIRQAWGVDATDVVVGHLANKSQEKGTVDLLLSVRSLWERGITVHVALAGPEMPNFRRFWGGFSAELPPDWRARVQRLETLSEDERRDFFAGLDIFALPSRSDSFGLVLLEAWANGVPNVAYRAGGIADLIRDGVDGLLTPCGDVAALSQALHRLASDERRRRGLGDAGRARLPQEFRWSDKLSLVRYALGRVAASARSAVVV